MANPNDTIEFDRRATDKILLERIDATNSRVDKVMHELTDLNRAIMGNGGRLGLRTEVEILKRAEKARSAREWAIVSLLIGLFLKAMWDVVASQ